MAQIILNIADNQITEILNAFDAVYPSRGSGTKADWAKLKVADYIREIVKRYRVEEASKTVSQAVIDIT